MCICIFQCISNTCKHTYRYIHLTKHEWGVELPCALCVGPFVSANSFVNRKFGSHGTEEGGGAAFLWLRPDQCMGESEGGVNIFGPCSHFVF